MQYAVVIEKAGGNHSACVPDLPGTRLALACSRTATIAAATINGARTCGAARA